MGYTSEIIYRVYFPDSWRIETVQDLEFDKSYSYKEIGITVVEELFFSFHKLESFTNNTYNTPVKKEEELLAIPSTPSVTHLNVKDDNSDRFSFASSDDDTPPF